MEPKKLTEKNINIFKLKITALVAMVYTKIFERFNPLTAKLFTHLKLCLADAIHNFKWVKIIQIWQNEG